MYNLFEFSNNPLAEVLRSPKCVVIAFSWCAPRKDTGYSTMMPIRKFSYWYGCNLQLFNKNNAYLFRNSVWHIDVQLVFCWMDNFRCSCDAYTVRSHQWTRFPICCLFPFLCFDQLLLANTSHQLDISRKLFKREISKQRKDFTKNIIIRYAICEQTEPLHGDSS